jgi:hypothetical protein
MALQRKAIEWLENRSDDDIQEILQELAEHKGIVTKSEYSKILCIPERTVYAEIESGKIKTFEFCSKKYPFINL